MIEILHKLCLKLGLKDNNYYLLVMFYRIYHDRFAFKMEYLFGNIIQEIKKNIKLYKIICSVK